MALFCAVRPAWLGPSDEARQAGRSGVAFKHRSACRARAARQHREVRWASLKTRCRDWRTSASYHIGCPCLMCPIANASSHHPDCSMEGCLRSWQRRNASRSGRLGPPLPELGGSRSVLQGLPASSWSMPHADLLPGDHEEVIAESGVRRGAQPAASDLAPDRHQPPLHQNLISR